MEDKSIQCAINDNITDAGISWNHESDNGEDPTIYNGYVVKAFPVQNQGSPDTINTPDNWKDFPKETNGIVDEPPTIKAHPSVTNISNGKHTFLQKVSLKRKRNVHSLDLVTNTLQHFKHSPVESLPSPPSHENGSIVTVLKYQNGDFVEIQSSSSMYNSPMRLRDMRNAITASLKSCISQPGTDFPCHSGNPWSGNTGAQETSSEVKERGENAEISKKPTELSKERKLSSSSLTHVKRINSPNEESIKFANRQKELMRMKKELKKKIRQETGEGGDPSNSKTRVTWGRTVGVVCTMCGKHVQKSYGCFRRESAPEKLKHLFTPGMNRIKICRRCLPYKKNPANGEDDKKTGRKGGGKVLGNDSRKSQNVIKHVVNRETPSMKTEMSNDKPVSTATLDAIHRKLNTANGATDSRFNSPPKIILNESAKGGAMEYIKKLAENLKANYNQDVGPPTVQNKTPLSQPHVSSITPMTPSSNRTSLVYRGRSEETGTNLITTRWTPLMVNQKSSPVTPASNGVQPNVRPITKHEESDSILMSTPPWTPVSASQTPSRMISSSLSQESQPEAGTISGAQNSTKSSGNQVQAIPAIVMSTQNSVPGQASVLLQIQRVKLVRERVGESKEARTKLKVDEDTTGGKNKRSRTNGHRPVVCVSCKTNVVKSYRCISQSLSPPKLQHLFSNDKEVLRFCRKCLFKDGASQHKAEKKEKVDDKSNEVTGRVVGREYITENKDEECTRTTEGQVGQRGENFVVNVSDDSLLTALKDNSRNAEPTNGLNGNSDISENQESTGIPRDTCGSGDTESTSNSCYGTVESAASGGVLKNAGKNDCTLPDYDSKVEKVEAAETSMDNNQSLVLSEILNQDSEEVRPRESFGTPGVFKEDSQHEFTSDVEDIIPSEVTIGAPMNNDENLGLEVVQLLKGEKVDQEDSAVTAINKVDEDMMESNEKRTVLLEGVLQQEKTKEFKRGSGALDELKTECTVKKEELGNENTTHVVDNEIDKGNDDCECQVESLYQENEVEAIEATPSNKLGETNKVKEESLKEETKEIPWTREEVSVEGQGEIKIHFLKGREKEEKDDSGWKSSAKEEAKKTGVEDGDATVRNEDLEKQSEMEKILDENKVRYATEQSKIKGSGKVNAEKNVKSTSPESVSTESNAVKDNDKKLRKRRVVESPRCLAKTEKKMESKWQDKTRGALLKKQNEAVSSFETTQGVKRKIGKRQCRGKKARLEEDGSKATLEETRISKQDQQLPKDVKSSPTKRMKKRKN